MYESLDTAGVVDSPRHAGRDVAAVATRRERDDRGSAHLADAPPTSLHPPRISRFTIHRVLGAGGMGVVYSAYDEELARRVAIKVLHAERPDASRGRERMLREAQALARLAHPNVVRIYEVGEFDRQLYLAMEFLQGDTLRAWQTARPRGWRDVLAVYCQSGRGLAAAHAAGIVHRDFKPDNVVVGDDGFVRVLDFGVARAGAEESTSTGADGRILTACTGTLTREGSLIGTPAYMSLEQLRGCPASPLSDQFSFCVALHEALYGVRPFRGVHLADLRRSVALGRIEEPPRGARVPPWLRRVILRGLDNEPERRWPSMQALVAALERDPGRRWRQRMATAALVAVASGATFAATHGDDPPVDGCEDAAARLAGVWDAPRRVALTRAFRASGLAYAPAVAEHVVLQLDGYAEQWSTAYTAACEATELRIDSSEALLDLRMACLGQRRAEFGALVELLADADERTIERAVQAATSLRPVAACDGDAAPLFGPAPPAAGTAADVAAVREQIAAARAHQIVGDYDEGLVMAGDALRRAKMIGYRPLIAEATQRIGELQHNASAFAAAETSLVDAYFTAETLRHDEIQLAAAVRLSYLVGVHQARHAEGLLWSRHAQALLDRGGAAVDEEIVLLHAVGMIHAQQGDAESARGLLERSLALTREHMGPDEPQAAAILIDLGNLDNDRGDHERAQPRYEQAHAVIERSLGPEHPLAVKTLNNLGNALLGQGRTRAAREHLERALGLAGRVLPPDHPSTAIVRSSLGDVFAAEGRWAEAESFLVRSLAALEAAFGPDHPHVAAVLTSLCDVRRRQGELAAARADLARAFAIAERLGPDHPDLAAPLTAQGELLLAEGDHAGASAAFARALAVVEKASGSSHRHVVAPLIGLGEAGLADGRPAEAVASFERALAMTRHARVAPGRIARALFGLARARWAMGSDRSEAAALARAAEQALQDAGDGHAPELANVRRWLASR